ncbi:MAG: pseudouridine synthase [Oscillospiraceae bacterium]
MRIDKYIAAAKGFTRSEARKAIASGLVRLNGAVCKDSGAQADDTSEVQYKGVTLSADEYIYIMLDKPLGVVSASRDKNDITVVSLVQNDYPNRELFPAGRLDKNSTGFVLITDDGDFAHNILAPRHHVSKTYEVELDTPLTSEMISAFANGVTLADGTHLSAAVAEHMQKDNMARVVLKQGVYHQIKRMFGVYGAGVNALRRVAIGALELDSTLGSGGYRAITAKELENITWL